MQVWKDEGELSRWVPVCKPQCALDLGLFVIVSEALLVRGRASLRDHRHHKIDPGSGLRCRNATRSHAPAEEETA